MRTTELNLAPNGAHGGTRPTTGYYKPKKQKFMPHASRITDHASRITFSPTNPLIPLQHRPHFDQQIQLRKLFIRSLVRPDADQPEMVAVWKPIGDLLD